MALVDLATFKAFLGTDRAVTDELNTLALSAAERGVRQYCKRNLVAADTVATARTYRPAGSIVRIHDAAEITAVVDDVTPLASADYLADPLSQRSMSGDWRPYEQLERVGYDWWVVDGTRETVTVTARWGWDEIPDEARMAVLILGKDIVASKNISFGIAGFTDYAGVRARENMQVAGLLGDLRRVEAFGIA